MSLQVVPTTISLVTEGTGKWSDTFMAFGQMPFEAVKLCERLATCGSVACWPKADFFLTLGNVGTFFAHTRVLDHDIHLIVDIIIIINFVHFNFGDCVGGKEVTTHQRIGCDNGHPARGAISGGGHNPVHNRGDDIAVGIGEGQCRVVAGIQIGSPAGATTRVPGKGDDGRSGGKRMHPGSV